jgi:predicted nucleic acid-binding protein
MEFLVNTLGRMCEMRVMFDTMGYDRLSQDEATRRKLMEMIEEGKVVLLTTHIQRDEIMAMNDEAKKSKLLQLLKHAQFIATRGAVYGLSRYGQSRYGSDEDHTIIERIRGKRRDRDTEDSLIAATASGEADTLVTDDHRFTNRLTKVDVKCEVIDYVEFKRRLES